MAQELPGGEAERCHICLEASPLPIQSGCACRGAAGLAHVGCRIQAATVLRNIGLTVVSRLYNFDLELDSSFYFRVKVQLFRSTTFG